MSGYVARDPIALAWAAGLFEGEGSFSLQRHRVAENIQLAASLSSTDEDVVRTFRSTLGIGNVRGPYYRRTRRHKPHWMWEASGAEVEQVYELLRPWLHRRRHARYAELLAERRAYEARLPAVYSERARRAQATRRRTLLQSHDHLEGWTLGGEPSE